MNSLSWSWLLKSYFSSYAVWTSEQSHSISLHVNENLLESAVIQTLNFESGQAINNLHTANKRPSLIQGETLVYNSKAAKTNHWCNRRFSVTEELEGKVKSRANYERLQELQSSLVWPSITELDPKTYVPEVRND